MVDAVVISQPPLSYTTMRSDEYNGMQLTNDGCNASTNGTVNCGVGTTLMDCERGSTQDLDFTDLSDYFVWSRFSSPEIRNVSTLIRFPQPVNIRRVSLWFWNAPSGGIITPNLMLYSSNEDTTIPSNPVTIDTSDSQTPVENERLRINVDITDDGLMIQSLRIMMTISEGNNIFLSEVFFCGKYMYSKHDSKVSDISLCGGLRANLKRFSHSQCSIFFCQFHSYLIYVVA